MSVCTSFISSTASAGDIFHPSYNIFKPKITKRPTDTQRVMVGGMNLRKTSPKAAERTVMMIKERREPAKTVKRGYFYKRGFITVFKIKFDKKL